MQVCNTYASSHAFSKASVGHSGLGNWPNIPVEPVDKIDPYDYAYSEKFQGFIGLTMSQCSNEARIRIWGYVVNTFPQYDNNMMYQLLSEQEHDHEHNNPFNPELAEIFHRRYIYIKAIKAWLGVDVDA